MRDWITRLFGRMSQVVETAIFAVKRVFTNSRLGRWLLDIRPTWSEPDPVSGIRLIGKGQPRWKELANKAKPWIMAVAVVKITVLLCLIFGAKVVAIYALKVVAFVALLILLEYLLRIVAPLILGAVIIIGACLSIGWGFISSKLNTQRATD